MAFVAFIRVILFFRGGLYVHPLIEARFHTRRTAGGNRDHRCVDRAVAAGNPAGPRGRPAESMLQQGEAVGHCSAEPSRRLQEVSGHQQPGDQHRRGQRLLAKPGEPSESGNRTVHGLHGGRIEHSSVRRLQLDREILPYMDEGPLYNTISQASAKFSADAFNPYSSTVTAGTVSTGQNDSITTTTGGTTTSKHFAAVQFGPNRLRPATPERRRCRPRNFPEPQPFRAFTPPRHTWERWAAPRQP